MALLAGFLYDEGKSCFVFCFDNCQPYVVNAVTGSRANDFLHTLSAPPETRTGPKDWALL